MKEFLYSKAAKIIAMILCAATLAGMNAIIFYSAFQLQSEEIVYHLEQDFNESNSTLSQALSKPAELMEDAISEALERDPALTEDNTVLSEDTAKLLDHTLREKLYRIDKDKVWYYAVVNGIPYTNCSDSEPMQYEAAAYHTISDDTVSSGRPLPTHFSVPVTYYAKITPEYAQKLELLWNTQKKLIYSAILLSLSLLLLALILLIYLLCVCGRKGKNQPIQLSSVDYWYTEFGIFALFLFPCLTILAVACGFSGIFDHEISYTLSLGASSGGIFLSVLATETVLLSMVRKLKAKSFLKTSLTYRILQFLYRIWMRIWKKLQSYFGRLSQISDKKNGYILAFFLGTRKYRLFEELKTALERLSSGNTDCQILDADESVLGKMCQNVNQIQDGLKLSVEQAVKAERMKTELITNVSHDLKTPLTSIINYTQLLSELELSPPEAADYVKIIAKKSDRLKQLTSDLFDISRIQSGNESLTLEALDAAELVSQAMGELDHEIQASGLCFCTRLSENLCILADGKKMSRVISNLISNILKYTQKGTRVFLSVLEQDQKVIIEMKNTSAYPLEFDAEEITERFVRGDSSRSEEGNGLGLAIAKSYTIACGGEFQIKLDGDLFKVTIRFPKC